MEYFDKYINPIHLLGLRSYLRTKRFLYTFNISVILMITAMLLGFFFMSIENMSTAEIGKILFTIFSIMQYTIISLIFPAFSCTAIIAEKEAKTYDLLITANLTSGQIVWGKFLSAFTHCAMFLVSSLPIVMMAFLFGGITPALITITYFVFICIFSSNRHDLFGDFQCIKNDYSGNYRQLCHCNRVEQLFGTSTWVFVSRLPTLFRNQYLFTMLGGYSSLNAILTIYVMPIFIFCSLIFLPYLIAKNSLRTYANNRSTALRVYFCIVGSLALTIFLAYYINSVYNYIGSALEIEMILFFHAVIFAVIGFLSLVGSMGFASEDPVPEKFVMKRLTEHLQSKRLLKIFSHKIFLGLIGPGAYRGARLVTLMSLLWMSVYIGASYLLLETFGVKNNYRFNRYNGNILYYTIGPAAVVFSFVYFISMFSTFLAFRYSTKRFSQSRIILRRTICHGTSTSLCIVPLRSGKLLQSNTSEFTILISEFMLYTELFPNRPSSDCLF